MRVVFMGTPDFAVPCLQNLLDSGFEVAGVFTQPDKPVGRKQTLTPPPVKELAVKHGIRVFQPPTLRTPEAVETVRGLAPEAIVVAAYGKILPKTVLDIPKYGCVNVHGSLLPKYRGAAPIQWAVINGEKETGVTTMLMAEGIDTGDILLSESTPVDPDETAGELFERLSTIGASLLVRTLEGLREGTVSRTPQKDGESCYAPMLKRELSRVDWSRPAVEIHNLVRGLNPWPAAETSYRGKRLKILRTRILSGEKGEAGQPFARPDGAFRVGCGDSAVLELLEVQPEGGKKMNGKDFLRGHPAQDGERFQ